MESGYYFRLLDKGFLKADDLEPDIGPFDFYIDAFRELSTCRPAGLGVGPIPFTAILEYSRLYDVGDFEDFLYFMRVLDDAYLKLEGAKQNSQGKANGPTNSGSANQHSRRHQGK